MRVVIVLCLAVHGVAADPAPEAALRGGVMTSSRGRYSWLPHGDGAYAEAEGGVRWPYVTLSVVGAVARLHGTSLAYDLLPITSVDATATLLDAGIRATATYRGAFAGVGLLYDHLIERGTTTRIVDGTTRPIDESHHGVMYELHAGYTVPLDLGPTRLQILGALTYGTDPETSDASATSARLLLGLTL